MGEQAGQPHQEEGQYLMKLFTLIVRLVRHAFGKKEYVGRRRK